MDTNTLIQNNIDSLAESFEQALEAALADYEKLQAPSEASAKTKGKLSNIYISILQSSVPCKLPWFRIDLYDENGIADTIECFSDWDVQPIAENLYKHAETLAAQKYETENIRVSEYELERICIGIADEYFQAFESHMPLILSNCAAARKLDCRWHYGQLFGRTAAIKPLETEEERGDTNEIF